MTPIRLQTRYTHGVTTLPDSFIDCHFAEVDGCAVKVYLALLRSMRQTGDLTIQSLAGVCGCTDQDVIDALSLWADRGVLSVTYEHGTVTELVLFPDTTASGVETPREIAHATPATLSRDRSRSLMRDREEAREVIYIAEQYLGRTLSSADINRLLYLYDELDFSVDLIDYLVEHCVSLGKHSMHYVEKVGLGWYNDGIRTVEDARERTATWGRDYFAILRAFGISGRNPVPHETTYMDRWLSEYRFPLELIKEACARTIAAKGQVSFDYAEGILASWRRENVLTMEDIAELDRRHSASQKRLRETQKTAGGSGTERSRKNAFHDFHQRDYKDQDFERKLLEGQRNDRKDDAE